MGLSRFQLGRLKWAEVRRYAPHYFAYWQDGEDFLWFKYCWNVLERSGQTNFSSEGEEAAVRAIPGRLALYYGEFVYRLHYVPIEIPADVVADLVNENRQEIAKTISTCRAVLTDHFGEKEFLKCTLLSVIAGANELMSFQGIAKEMDAVVQSLSRTADVYLNRASDFLLGGSVDPYSFVSISDSIPSHWHPRGE